MYEGFVRFPLTLHLIFMKRAATMKPSQEQIEHLRRSLTLVMRNVVTSVPMPPSMAKLPMMQYKCLQLVIEREGSKLVDIAQALGVALPSASRLVERLVRQGLVERKPDPYDRRAVRLTLTERSREAASQLHSERLAHLSDCIKDMDAELLNKIIEALDILATTSNRLHLPDDEKYPILPIGLNVDRLSSENSIVHQ